MLSVASFISVIVIALQSLNWVIDCLFYFASSLYSTVHVNIFVNRIASEFCLKTSFRQQNVVSGCLISAYTAVHRCKNVEIKIKNVKKRNLHLCCCSVALLTFIQTSHKLSLMVVSIDWIWLSTTTLQSLKMWVYFWLWVISVSMWIIPQF